MEPVLVVLVTRECSSNNCGRPASVYVYQGAAARLMKPVRAETARQQFNKLYRKEC